MYSEISDIQLCALASCLPEHRVYNTDYASVFGEKEVKKQIKVTGINERRCLTGDQTVIDLSMHAIDVALKHTGWPGESIDALVYVSAYREDSEKPTARLLLERIGAKQSCVGYDINLGCSAFVNGLFAISSLLKSMPVGAKGLLVVSDSTSIGGDHDDKTVSMLSGDCSTVTALQHIDEENEDERTPFRFSQHFDGSRYEFLMRRSLKKNLEMDGMAVFNFAITDVSESIREYLAHFGISEEGYDFFVLHQAQKFIVDKVAQFSELPKERVLTSYDLYGNTGGPSLPATVCANREEINKKTTNGRIKLFLAGFGSGMSWGFVSLDINPKDILDPVYTDKLYDEPTAIEDIEEEKEPIRKNATRMVRNKLDESGWKAEDIQFVFLVTETPDLLIPSTASAIHKDLGCSTECLAWDIKTEDMTEDGVSELIRPVMPYLGEGVKGICILYDIGKVITYENGG